MPFKRITSREGILSSMPLREHFVFWMDINHGQVAALKRRLKTATNEEDMQKFLLKHPVFMIQHLGGGHGRWVIPKKRLGAEFVPDFVIGDLDSAGHEWELVEIESPKAKLFTKDGVPSRSLNQALRQIRDWRAWLTSNRAYAISPREENGLGLVDIAPNPPGLILIGRRSSLVSADKARRRQLEQDSGVTIHTYDWLVELAEGRAEAAGFFGPWK